MKYSLLGTLVVFSIFAQQNPSKYVKRILLSQGRRGALVFVENNLHQESEKNNLVSDEIIKQRRNAICQVGDKIEIDGKEISVGEVFNITY